MGLDLVELTLETERHFGIEIPDAAAATIRTPRQLAAFVASQLAARDALAPGPCLSQHAFYRLRGVLRERRCLPSDAVRPTVLLDRLLPRDGRARLWRDLRTESGIAGWPDLARPGWLKVSIGVLVAGGFLAGLVTPWPVRRSRTIVAIAIAAALLLLWLCLYVTRPLQVEVHPAGYTVGDLAHLQSAGVARPEPASMWTLEEVRADVRRLVSRELGVVNFTDDSDFVRDLRAD